MADDPIRTKLAAARTRLILDRPFIGALVMHLPLVARQEPGFPTTGTDARAFYYNPDFIAQLSFAQTQFMLAHEAMHCALGHFARRAHRVRLRWDVACDHAVNLLLIGEGLVPPPGALANPEFAGLTAEEIYPLIEAVTPERPLDVHDFDGAGSGGGAQRAGAQGSGEGQAQEPPPGAGASWDDAGDQAPAQPHRPGQAHPHTGELDALSQRWQSRLAAAAQAARQAGRLSDAWLRAIEHLIEPQLPWRNVLARHMMSVARDDYSFQRLSRREGAVLLPTLASGEVRLVIALDTSGSITEHELNEFVTEVDALKGQVRASVVIHACDEKLCRDGPWTFSAWEPVRLPKTIEGGGGTRFTPVFEWVERELMPPDLLVYFTDAQGEFPPQPPPYPVIWLVKGRSPVPWGERIQLN